MKHSAAEAKIGSSMIKGETPFDLAKVQEIYATFATDAAAMPTLFPGLLENRRSHHGRTGDLGQVGRFQGGDRQVRGGH